MRIPREIGPYLVLESLGDGGTGVVVSAQHRVSADTVAIKFPKGSRAEERALFSREIGVLQRLSSRNVRSVVKFVEHGEHAGQPWYAMEHIRGGSLRTWMTARIAAGRAEDSAVGGDTLILPDVLPVSQRALEEAIPPQGSASTQSILELSLKLAEALSHLHVLGVVHGDLTPQNVLLRNGDEPALIDFGTALVADDSDAHVAETLAAEAVRGTPGYVAPESLDAEPLDARSDLYALGCIIYELVSGRSPFHAATSQDVLRRQLHDVPRPLNEGARRVPPLLSEIVERLLRRNPAERPAHADEVCRVLEQCLERQHSGLLTDPSSPPLLRSRMHGRDVELERLEARALKASAGHGGVVLVEGATGIGKSRLLRELRHRGARRGLRVFTGQGRRSAPFTSRGIEATAFAAFEPVLRQLGEDLASEQRSVGLPQMTTAVPSSDPAETMHRVFLALQKAAEPEGALLLLDDVDAADELTRAFLKRYEKDLAQTHLLVVATTTAERGGELGLGDGSVDRMVLGELSNAEAQRMILDLLGERELPNGLVEFVRRRAGGYPFYIAEYVRAALAKGLLARRHARWVLTVSDSQLDGASVVPESIEQLLEARLAPLSPRARRALGAVSLCNHEFDDATFGLFVEDSAQVPEVLAELAVHEFVAATSRGTYRFTQDKIRTLLEERTVDADRAGLHRRLALHGQAHPHGAAGSDAVLGYHWAQAGEPARAVGFLESAASAASASHAAERAAELFRLATEQCEKLPSSPERDERLARLQEAQADALVKRARHAEARRLLSALLDGRTEGAPLREARLARKLAASSCTTHDYAEAARSLERAETALEQVAAKDDRQYLVELVQTRLGRFDLLYFSGQLGDELEALVQSTRPLIERHGTPEQACTYYFMAVSYRFLRRRYAFDDEALLLARRGVEAAEAAGNQRRGMAEFILGGALLLGTPAQCRRALEHFETAAKHAERSGDTTLLSRIRTYETVAHLRLGDVRTVEAAAQTALRAAEVAGLAPYVAAAHAFHGWVCWRQGETARAAELLASARARWKTSPHRFPFSNLAIFPLLDIAQVSDDVEGARLLLKELPQGLPALPETLNDAVRDALVAVESGEARSAVDAVAALARLAREHALA